MLASRGASRACHAKRWSHVLVQPSIEAKLRREFEVNHNSLTTYACLLVLLCTYQLQAPLPPPGAYMGIPYSLIISWGNIFEVEPDFP